MTPELAADKAASVLYLAEKAVKSDHELEKAAMQAAMLAGIAAVWVQLHTSLVNALKTAEPAEPPLNRLATAMTTSTPPADRREQAREWITSFMAATDDDRVNCVALLLCAADDALECALNHKRLRKKPEDRRPYRAPSEPGDEWVVTHAVSDGSGRKTRYTLRQVGWHGQSGAFYSLDEDPKPYEPGSWSTLWVIAHTDRLDEDGNPL